MDKSKWLHSALLLYLFVHISPHHTHFLLLYNCLLTLHCERRMIEHHPQPFSFIYPKTLIYCHCIKKSPLFKVVSLLKSLLGGAFKSKIWLLWCSHPMTRITESCSGGKFKCAIHPIIKIIKSSLTILYQTKMNYLANPYFPTTGDIFSGSDAGEDLSMTTFTYIYMYPFYKVSDEWGRW